MLSPKIIRSTVMLIFGLFLIFPFGGFFGALGSLHVLQVLMPLWVLGVVSVCGGLLSLIPRTVIGGTLVGVIVSGIVSVCGFLSLFFTPVPHPATLLLSIVVVMSYLEGLSESIHFKYRLFETIE